jgi:N-methylhydantoinase B
VSSLGDVLRFETLRIELQGLADEVALKFASSSFSPIIRDYLDFSTAICTPDGRMVAQGFSLPLHLGAIPRAMEAALRARPAGLAAGDVMIFNDPYAGGMHLPDIFMIAPAWVDGRLEGNLVVVAHHSDIGGRVPGGSGADSREIFEEGLRIPPLLLQQGGKPVSQVEDIIAANVRLPELVWSDIQAQLAGCLTGTAGLARLVRQHGHELFSDHAERLLAYSQRRIQTELASWPDGTFEFEDYEDHDGLMDCRVTLHVTVTISGGRIAIDFAGTSPQVAGAINATLSFTESACYAAVRALCSDDIPVNAGFLAAVEVRAPEGSVVNARFPAAVAARGVIGYRIVDAIFGALSAALPERVPAAGDGGISGIRMGGRRADGQRFQVNDIMCGAWGARPGLDGVDGAATMAANVANRSIEVTERDDPVRIHAYEFVGDTGGAGRWRGGLSLRRVVELLEEEAVLQIRTHRNPTPPYGLAGGSPGATSQTFLIRGGERMALPAKATLQIRRGEMVEHITAGGGGIGAPAERDPCAVRRDVTEGRISAINASRAYGLEELDSHDT